MGSIRCLQIWAYLLYMPRNDLRTLTGMGMGITIGVVMLLMLNLALRADLDDQQPPLQHIGDLAAILLLNLLILAVIYANLDLFYWHSRSLPSRASRGCST